MEQIERLKQKLYVDSPYDLATEEDDAYRNGVDFALEAVNALEFRLFNLVEIVKQLLSLPALNGDDLTQYEEETINEAIESIEKMENKNEKSNI